MKKIIFLGCVLLFAISCKAQSIVPVERKIDYIIAENGIPEGTYLKDVNNLLSKYVGTWKGTYAGKTYTLYITNYTYKPLKVTYDLLLTRYLITSSDGTILEDTRNLLDASPYVIEGDYFSKDLASYASNYIGKNSRCGNKGTTFFHMKNSTNTLMSFAFEPDKIMISEDTCPGLKLADLTFSKNDIMMLTKQ
jgi:hypothetical protein